MEKIEELRERRAKIYLGGGQRALEKQHERGKLTARERIDALLDPGTFVELGTFVKHRCHVLGMENKETPGEGVVAGHGRIDGRTVYVYSQDFTVLGGAVGEMHAAKIIAVQELAMKTGCPLIGLIDSGGGRLHEGVNTASGYGKIFYTQCLGVRDHSPDFRDSGTLCRRRLLLSRTDGFYSHRG